MAGVFRLHSKGHRTSHHTVSGTSEPGSGLDPIASEKFPFIGTFFNRLTDSAGSYNINTNSLEWWSAFSTVSGISSRWDPTLSIYNTNNSLSSRWQLGYSDYMSLKSVSASNNSVFTTINSNSANWSSPYILFTNEPHDTERAIVFSGVDLTADGAGSVAWDLNTQQVAFLTSPISVNITTPLNAKKGGYYILCIKNTGVTNININFSSAYKFNDINYPTNVINISLSHSRIIIKFVYDGEYMNGDVSLYVS